MNLNKSIVEDAALECFGELGYAVGHRPHIAPGESAAERDSFGELVLAGRLCESIRRLNPAISSRTLATLPDTLQKLWNGGLSLEEATAKI